MPRRGGGSNVRVNVHRSGPRPGAALAAGVIVGAALSRPKPTHTTVVVNNPQPQYQPQPQPQYQPQPQPQYQAQPQPQPQYQTQPQPHYEQSVVVVETSNKKRNGGFGCLVLVYLILVLVFAPWKTTFEPEGGMGEKETMLVEASNTWWKKIEVEAYTGNAAAVRVGRVVGTPQYTDQIREVDDTVIYNSIPTFGYEDISYYLNSGSTMEVTWGLSNAIDFYLIKSTKEMDRFDRGSSFSYERHVGGQNSYTFSYQVPSDSDDFYYAVFAARLSGTSGSVNAKIGLATYDFDAYTEPDTRCESTVCEVDLDRSGSTQNVLIDMQDVGRSEFPAVKITYHGRHEFYFSVFLGSLGCLLVLMSLLRCIKRKKAAQSQPMSAPTAGYSSM